jgi:putative heme transporter
VSASPPVESVPRSLRVAAALSWRVLIVAAAVLLVAVVLIQLRLAVLPVIVALLLATVLLPPLRALRRRGWPALLATWTVILGAVVVLAAVVALVSQGFISELDTLDARVDEGIGEVQQWLTDGPLQLPENALDDAVDRGRAFVSENGGVLVGGLTSGARLAAELVAGLLLAIVLLFFFLKDGDRIWGWIVGLFPSGQRGHVGEIGRRAWAALSGYVRGTAIVALVDAVLIGIVLAVLGVPLVVPLALLTFLAAFFPLVGAVIAGILAALVALVTEGTTDALIVAAAILVIQQLEGDVLQPIVLGKAVRLHPIAILLALTVGATLGGIIGAFLSVPVAAVGAAVLSYAREPESPAPPASAVTGAPEGPPPP